MKKLNLLVVLNNSPWSSLPQKLQRLKEWYAPRVDFKIDAAHTSFETIPFQPSFDNGTGFYRVDDAWYEQNIASLALGKYDVVLFVVPWKQWKKDNNAWGYKTYTTNGLVETQIACDENRVMYFKNPTGKMDDLGNNVDDAFFHQARHEIMHGMYFLTGQIDNTHKWVIEEKLEFALEELKFPEPKETPLPPDVLDKLFVWLALMGTWIKGGAKGSMPSIPKEILPEPTKTPPPPTKEEPVTPPPPKKPTLRAFCLAIQTFEDYVLPGGKYRNGVVAPRGSLSFINKNPGNVKWVQGQRLSIGKDSRGFAIFKTYEDGFAFLEAMVGNVVRGGGALYQPSMTFLQYFSKYAPSSDGNYPEIYAKFVADRCGVPITTTIGELEIIK